MILHEQDIVYQCCCSQVKKSIEKNFEKVFHKQLETGVTCLDKLGYLLKDRDLVSALTDVMENISADYDDAMQQARPRVISLKSSSSQFSSSAIASNALFYKKLSHQKRIYKQKKTKKLERKRVTKSTRKEDKSRTQNLMKLQYSNEDNNKGHNSNIGQDTWKQLKSYHSSLQ